MKICRYGPVGPEKPVVPHAAQAIRELSGDLDRLDMTNIRPQAAAGART
jgi:hypothetical protein